MTRPTRVLVTPPSATSPLADRITWALHDTSSRHPARPATIAAALRLPRGTVMAELQRMVAAGKLVAATVHKPKLHPTPEWVVWLPGVDAMFGARWSGSTLSNLFVPIEALRYRVRMLTAPRKRQTAIPAPQPPTQGASQ